MGLQESGTFRPGKYFSNFKMPDGRAQRGRPPRNSIPESSIVCRYILVYLSTYNIDRKLIFTQSLQFINSFYLVKLKYLSFSSTYRYFNMSFHQCPSPTLEKPMILLIQFIYYDFIQARLHVYPV